MNFFSFSIYGLHLYFGYWVLFRTLTALKNKSYFSNSFLTGLVSLYIGGCIVFMGFFSQMIFWYLWIYGFSLLIILIEKLFSIYKRKQFYIILLSFLDILILKIQLGESFRAGVIYATNRFEGYVRGQLEHLLQYIILMHQPSRASYPKYILDFIKELQFAEKSPHRALETLKHYQESLKFTNNLKKKYMDVTYQVYAQTIIMALLFISLLLYTIFNYHFFEHLILILSSVALFFTGILLVLIYGKKWKWKF